MKTTVSIILTLFSISLIAQYDVSTFVDDYNNLTDDLSLNIESDWDDPFFDLPLGFDFQAGSLISSGLTQEGFGSTFFLGTPDNGCAISYNPDLRDGVSFGEASLISYTVEGDAGNRICKVQYTNSAFYLEVESEGSAENRVNFQIWFYESDFSVEFRFGIGNVPNPDFAYYNLQGPGIGIFTGITNDGQSIEMATYLSGAPNNPVIESDTDPNQVEFSGLDGTPANGQVYRFTPTSLSVTYDRKKSFTVYPTLATEWLHIEGGSPANSVYRIINLSGQVLQSGILVENRIDIGSLPAGMYFVSIGNGSQKFLKQ